MKPLGSRLALATAKCGLHALVLGLLVWAAAARAADDRGVLSALHMLDYIGVDYTGAVQKGVVVSETEYLEQQEFAAEVGRTLERLGAPEVLQRQSAVLEQAISQRADPERVSKLTASLSEALLKVYPVANAPERAPDVAAAAPLYQQHCSTCHGANGAGDGPAAAGLAPAPTSFLDRERHQQRSVFALFNTLGTGVAGTAMPSFAALSEEQRWALAFHVSQLIYSASERERGEKLWREEAEAARAVPSLQALTALEPGAFQARYGSDGGVVLAHLRAHPEALAAQQHPLAVARARLEASARAYSAGRMDEATELAVSAYLDGVELAEADLAASDAELMTRIESAMMAYRSLLRAGAPATEVVAAQDRIQELLIEAQRSLDGPRSGTGSFVGGFVILAREGLEAILVLAAMFAFLRRTAQRAALRYVHAGWITALLLGLATWAASNWVVEISGASRELTEGWTALLAAALLLSVGFWMHGKSLSDRWQQYLAAKMGSALERGRPLGLGVLAFVAVYREVFETVLFYRALWSQGHHAAIALGLAVAAAVLAATTWAIFVMSARLPIRQLFGWSSALIVLLAVILAGKGVAALQAAGVLPVRSVEFVRIPVLGIYPNVQGLALQAAMFSLVLGGFAWTHWGARPSTPSGRDIAPLDS